MLLGLDGAGSDSEDIHARNGVVVPIHIHSDLQRRSVKTPRKITGELGLLCWRGEGTENQKGIGRENGGQMVENAWPTRSRCCPGAAAAGL